MWMLAPTLAALFVLMGHAWWRTRQPAVTEILVAAGLTLSEVAVLARPAAREPVDSALAVLSRQGRVELAVPQRSARALLTGGYSRHGGTVRLRDGGTPADPAHAAVTAVIAELGGAGRPVPVREVRERAADRPEIRAVRARLIGAGLLVAPGPARMLRAWGVLLALVGALALLTVLARPFTAELPEQLRTLVRSLPNLAGVLLGGPAVALGMMGLVAAGEEHTRAGDRLVGELAARYAAEPDPEAFLLALRGLQEHPDEQLRLAVGVIPPPTD